MKQSAMIFGSLAVFTAVGTVTAVGLEGRELHPATLSTPGTTRVLNLPAEAANSNVIYLGEAFDVDSGEVVQGFAHITRHEDFKKNYAKPPWAGGGNTDTGSTSTCFAYQAKGAKWKAIEPWVVNTNNNSGISTTDIFSRMEQSVNEWENAADGSIDGSVVDIFGQGSTTSAILEADTVSTDGVNEVYFGEIEEPGVIAVTIVWGVFGGNPNSRRLVEWDQVYDQADFSWNISGNANDMDFLNIAVHEVGHAFGMDHPDATCSDETMYAYASEGETIKRDLNAGDIAGIDGLY